MHHQTQWQGALLFFARATCSTAWWSTAWPLSAGFSWTSSDFVGFWRRLGCRLLQGWPTKFSRSLHLMLPHLRFVAVSLLPLPVAAEIDTASLACRPGPVGVSWPPDSQKSTSPGSGQALRTDSIHFASAHMCTKDSVPSRALAILPAGLPDC